MTLWDKLFRNPRLSRDSEVPLETTASGVSIDVDELIQLRLRARGLELRAQRTVATTLAGGHGSRFRGRGMDYLESRQYQPGDDIRNMDWRITARVGRPHTKLYREERERPVMVVVDLGPSMQFGTRGAFKSVVAARAAALIGWAAVSRGDRIGAILFNAEHEEIPPRGGRRGVMGLIRRLADASATGRTASAGESGFNTALQRMRRVVRPGSLIFLFSDFYGIDGSTSMHLMRIRQHNDLIACQVLDALEVRAPPPGLYGVTDGERVTSMDTRDKGRRAAYMKFFDAHHASVDALMARFSIPLLRLSTTDDVVEKMAAGLATTSGKIRKSRGVSV